VAGVLGSNPLSRDLKILSFSLQVHGKRLVEDTTLELSYGQRYGLIGSNGCGKSTFLTCLAARELPLPEHVDIFHLDEEAETSDRTALQAVIDVVQAQVQRLEAMAEHLCETAGPDNELLLDIYDRIDRMDPNTFELRATEILMGLGFSQDFLKKKTQDLSGGWRMRVALGRALLSQPALLLLDEPTNHLDMESCVWLEKYLAKYPAILILVSHSQDFLNGVCNNMIHLTPERGFVYYSGNYDSFVKTKADNEVNQMKRYEKETADIKHLKEFISTCGTYSNLVKQAQSKQKIIDKMVEAGLTKKPENER
ncbi:P-loop containing nucleoside triphosphate hydrolase protein, partial [Baffinella frigidus]